MLDPIVYVFAILVVTLILNLPIPGFLGVSFNTVLSELLDIHRFHAR